MTFFFSLSLGCEMLIQEALTTPHLVSSWRLRDDMTLLVSSSDLTHARRPPLWACGYAANSVGNGLYTR